MDETNRWHRHPTRSGVLVRHLPPNYQPPKSNSAARRDAAREAARTAPLPILSWEQIERIANNSSATLGGTIEDIIDQRSRLFRSGETLVASRSYLLYIRFEDDQGEPTQISDGIWVTLYRDPESPSRILATY